MPTPPTFVARLIGPIRGSEAARRHAVSPIDVRAVVGELKIGHLDPAFLLNAPGGLTIHLQGTVRLDRQPNTTAGDANLQVQVNDVPRAGGSSIAQVLVPIVTFQCANTHPERLNATNHLLNIVRSTLLRSAGDGMSYTIVVT